MEVVERLSVPDVGPIDGPTVDEEDGRHEMTVNADSVRCRQEHIALWCLVVQGTGCYADRPDCLHPVAIARSVERPTTNPFDGLRATVGCHDLVADAEVFDGNVALIGENVGATQEATGGAAAAAAAGVSPATFSLPMAVSMSVVMASAPSPPSSPIA